jgi:hypothetical protein
MLLRFRPHQVKEAANQTFAVGLTRDEDEDYSTEMTNFQYYNRR